MSTFSNLMLALLRRIDLLLSAPVSDLSLPSTQRVDTGAVLAAYALGWREGLQAAVKYLEDLGFERDVTNVEEHLESLSLTPWPDHPEYGWRQDEETQRERTNITPTLSIELDPDNHPGVLTKTYSRLDCVGQDNQTKASVESCTWTGASDMVDGYPV